MRKIYCIIIACLCVLVSCRPKNEDPDLITTSRLRITCGFNGKTDTVNVAASNNEWSAECSEQWVKLVKFAPDSLSITIDANITLSPRNATINLICGSASAAVGVEQLSVPNGKLEQTLDSLALISIYNSCGGENWYYLPDKNSRPWPLEKPVSQWHGVQTNLTGGQYRVYSLDLRALGLTGALPQEIVNLTALIELLVSGNEINVNPLPLIAKLPKIISVDIGYNTYRGDENLADAGYLKNLISFNISGINCNGKYPSYIAKMAELRLLYMAGCNIGGGISGDLKGLKYINELDLSDNPLGGSIPLWISSLTDLIYLDLSTCGLTGQIPSDIGSLTAMETLKLGYNSLSGAVPVSVGNMTKLQILNLSDNQLTVLTANIEYCTSLKFLDISFNKLTSLPSGVGIDGLEEFNASYNSISGVIPPSLYENTSIITLDLSGNAISGVLSPLFGNNGSLKSLILNNNNLTGNIDANIAKAKNITTLNLYGNRMSGKLPTIITGDIRYTGYDETYPPDEFNDDPVTIHIDGVWHPQTMILPQQDGYILEQ